MSCLELTEQVFIAKFPEFENAANIDLMIERALNWFDLHCSHLNCSQKQYIIFLLTAHFLSQQTAIQNGDTTGGIQTSASIDKVSVSFATPPYSDAFDYEMNQSPYGQQLLAFFNLQIATPGYIGGSFIRVFNR